MQLGDSRVYGLRQAFRELPAGVGKVPANHVEAYQPKITLVHIKEPFRANTARELA